jgi:transcriptional accessory protein Tex/SPT6
MVTKLVTFGAFARIEGPVEGLIHVSELVDRRIAHPKEVVREGDLLPLKIVRIERDRHRLGLSLREARDEGLKMGFTFSDAGEVIQVPPDMKREFEEREGISVAERGPDDYSAPPTVAPKAEAPAAPGEAEAPAPKREPEPEPPSAMAQAFADAQAQLAKSEETAAPEDAASTGDAGSTEDAPTTGESEADAVTTTDDTTDA